MSGIPDEAVAAAAEAMAEMWNQRLSEEDAPYIPSDFTLDARDILTAAAPIIRADERRRIAEEIRAAEWPTDKAKTESLDFGYALGRSAGLDIAAQIAERSGE